MTPETFIMKIEGGSAESGLVPVSVLIQVLEHAQHAYSLIGLFVEGREIRDRSRITAQIENKYQLRCQIPIKGSYALPITIGDPTFDLLASQKIEEAWGIFKGSLTAIAKKSLDSLHAYIPDNGLRKRVLESLRSMSPKPGANWRLSLIQGDITFSTFDSLTSATIQKAIALPEMREATQTVTGELKQIDFTARKLTIIYPPTNRTLDCFYTDELEQLLFENRRDYIQVTGNIIYDERDLPKEIKDVTDISDLDLASFEIESFTWEGLSFKALKPLSIEPVLDETKQYICLQHPKLHIDVFAQRREQLLSELYEQIAMLWKEYALADSSELTADALLIKTALHDYFVVQTDAS